VTERVGIGRHEVKVRSPPDITVRCESYMQLLKQLVIHGDLITMTSTMAARSQRIVLCIVGVLLLLTSIHLWSTPSSNSLTPMPGTYQYFKEIDFKYDTKLVGAISHCDQRYASAQPLSMEETPLTMYDLLHSFAIAMQKPHAEWWIAHGTLMGWYWNGKFLPWDNDIDVQIKVETLDDLLSYNMTTYDYVVEEDNVNRAYVLDINPHYTLPFMEDVANKIDARWIDTSNGKYIDITAVHASAERTKDGRLKQESLFCKDGHKYERDDLFPLVEGYFEGIHVKTPHRSSKILRHEYGDKSLSNPKMHWYVNA